MNDNLQPLPDEHLEARITAYVLGEASPFESAELESLIGKSPELKLFLNRTRTLHTLLAEAETSSNSASEEWKLPPGKREKLNEFYGAKNTIPFNKESRIRRASFRAAIGIAACFVVTFIISRLYVFPKITEESAMSANFMAQEDSAVSAEADIAQLRRAVHEQEDKVEERRKLLTTISRTKEIAYYGERGVADERKRENLELSIDTQDYVDAKRDFETDQALLEQLKLRLASEEVEALPSENMELALNRLSPSSRPRKPQAPSSYTSGKAIAANTTSPSSVPVPGLATAEPSRDFGDGSEFGAGWGGGREKGKESAKAAESAGNEIASLGMRSGDAAITRNSIDAILNNPDRPEVLEMPGSESDAFAAKPSPPMGGLMEKKAEFDEQVYALPGAPAATSGEKVPMEFNTRNARARIESGAAYDIEEIRGSDFGNDSPDISNYILSDIGVQDELDLHTGDNVRFYMNSPGVTTRSGAASNYEVIPEFVYPTEYEPPTLSEGNQKGKEQNGAPVAEADPFFDTSGTVAKADGSKGNTEYEIHTGYAYEYVFRGVDLGKDKESMPAADLDVKGESDLAAVEEKLRELKDRIEEPSINDSNKQALFKEWKQLQAKSIAKYNRQSAPIDLADLSQEIPATQEPFSTFSLNISDASFQIARAAIEKGEQPDPDSIKPEQFYNAVDYGDPAPSSLESVSAAIDQTAHPVIPGRNLVRVALRTASTGRSAAQPLRLTLLVDQSGSMVRADRRAAMETALEQLATLLTENDEVTVIGFSRTPRLLADSMKGNEAGKLPALINQTANEGGTNLEQAINLASELALRHKLDGAQNRIVLFTDGAANLGNANPERLSDKIETLRQQGLAFDIAGIGTNDLNDNLLAELARHGNGRYYLVGENTGASLAAQLAGAFRPAAENVKVQVKLNPQRVGNYKLIGFEKDRLKTEDFRNDSVDAAELAADEAGVAMYQVETLPEGSGEIGEVSVRFRDTASGEMVERTWTIPYESSTPALDKADPKTQLATLSLLAAQKLQPGPLADAISFRNFSETIARLKQTYANDAKAQQMLNFVNALK